MVCNTVQALPECEGEYGAQWTNCEGTFMLPNVGKYVGEWKDGKYHGQATLTLADGRKYVGEFKDGSWDGLGTLTCGSKKYTLKGGKIDCKPRRKIEAIWEDGSPIDFLRIK